MQSCHNEQSVTSVALIRAYRMPKPQINMDFVFVDAKTNETILLEGILEPIRVPDHVLNPDISMTTTEEPNVLEANGPLFYVVAVIIVYGLSMFALVGTLLRRKSRQKLLDQEVTRYMRGLKDVHETAKKESVQRTRIRWPGNFIPLPKKLGARQSTTGAVDDEHDNDDSNRYSVSMMNDVESCDSGSCLELPAVTIPTPTTESSEQNTATDRNNSITRRLTTNAEVNVTPAALLPARNRTTQA